MVRTYPRELPSRRERCSDGGEDQEAFWAQERIVFREFWKPSPVAHGSPFSAPGSRLPSRLSLSIVAILTKRRRRARTALQGAYRGFEEAREVARTMGLSSHEDWEKIIARGDLPIDIPQVKWGPMPPSLRPEAN